MSMGHRLRWILPAVLLTLACCEKPEGGQTATHLTGAPEAEAAESDAAPAHPGSGKSAEEALGALQGLGLEVSAGEQMAPSMARIDAFLADASRLGGAGVFIDPVTLAVPYQVVDEATRLRVDLGNCEEVTVAGVVGVDATLQVALLELTSPPVGVVPLDLAPLPSPGDPLGHRGMLSIIRPDCGFAAAECSDCLVCVDVRLLQGLGEVVIVDIPTGVFAYGSPLLDEAGACAGLLLGPAGGGSSFAFPAAGVVSIERGEPMTPEVFAARERTDAERGLLHRHRAERWRIAGDIPRAMTEVQLALEATPQDWDAIYELGVCQDLMGDQAASIESLTRSIAIEPAYAESRYSLGIVRLRTGDSEAGLPQLREAARLAPEYASAHAMLALALFNAGEVDEALETAEHALSLHGVEPEHYLNLCMLYQQLHRPEEAEGIARRWTDEHRSEPLAWHALGHMLYEQERFEEAIAPLETALKLGDARAATYHFLIISLGSSGHEARATSFLDEGLERHPRDQVLLRIRRMLAGGTDDGG